MKTRELKIEGMTCGHCVKSVQRELSKIPTMTVEKVQIGKARVQYDESKITEGQLAEAIGEAGYRLVQ